MKATRYLFMTTLIVVTIHPAFGKCLGNVLERYLQHHTENTNAGNIWGDRAQFALVTVVAISADVIPQESWKETGTLTLKTIEAAHFPWTSSSASLPLPAIFLAEYHKRFGEGDDCETWDFIVPKPGQRLLAFFQLKNGEWEIPEEGASGIVNDVHEMPTELRAKLQPFFQTSLTPVTSN